MDEQPTKPPLIIRPQSIDPEKPYRPPVDPQRFIDVTTITQEQLMRLHEWADILIRKHERFLVAKKVPNRRIFIRDRVFPEGVDIPQIYPFRSLSYAIYRDGNFWVIMLLDGNRMIVKKTYLREP